MFDYRIIDEQGRVTVIRARNFWSAVKVFCDAEGIDRRFLRAHYVVRRA